MEMKGITRLHPIPEASWRALAAGADIVLMKAEDETCEKTFEAVLEAVRRGDLPLERLEEANRRVLALKMNYGIFDRPFADPAEALAAVKDPAVVHAARATVRRGITVPGNANVLPLKRDARLLVVDQVISGFRHSQAEDEHTHNGMLAEKVMKHTRHISHVQVAFTPDEEDLARVRAAAAGGHDAALITDWSYRNIDSNRALIEAVKAAGIPVVRLSNSPYADTPAELADASVFVFQPRGDGLEAVVDVIFGAAEAPGRWPLKEKPFGG
jgi:beta-N-acetylhexosaminidase